MDPHYACPRIEAEMEVYGVFCCCTCPTHLCMNPCCFWFPPLACLCHGLSLLCCEGHKSDRGGCENTWKYLVVPTLFFPCTFFKIAVCDYEPAIVKYKQVYAETKREREEQREKEEREREKQREKEEIEREYSQLFTENSQTGLSPNMHREYQHIVIRLDVLRKDIRLKEIKTLIEIATKDMNNHAIKSLVDERRNLGASAKPEVKADVLVASTALVETLKQYYAKLTEDENFSVEIGERISELVRLLTSVNTGLSSNDDKVVFTAIETFLSQSKSALVPLQLTSMVQVTEPVPRLPADNVIVETPEALGLSGDLVQKYTKLMDNLEVLCDQPKVQEAQNKIAQAKRDMNSGVLKQAQAQLKSHKTSNEVFTGSIMISAIKTLVTEMQNYYAKMSENEHFDVVVGDKCANTIKFLNEAEAAVNNNFQLELFLQRRQSVVTSMDIPYPPDLKKIEWSNIKVRVYTVLTLYICRPP